MTAVTGTGHDHDAVPSGLAVPSTAVTPRAHPDGHVPTRVGTAMDTRPDGGHGTGHASGHAGGHGVGTAGPRGSVTIPVTKTGRRRLLIMGPRRARVVGHVTIPVTAVPTSAPTHAEPAHRGVTGTGGWQRYRTALTVVVAVVASIGQVQFAKTVEFTHMIEVKGVFDLTPWLAIPVFDLAVAALLESGRRAIPTRLSPWPFWFGAFLVGGLSIYTNTQHRGAWITASASFVLCLAWFLTLLYEYRAWKRDQPENTDLLTSSIMWIDPGLAYRAWVITRTRPLTKCVQHRRDQGDGDLTLRDVAVLAARLYRDILTDQLATNLEGVRWWQRRRHRTARRTAEMTAVDNMDRWLGLPVIERTSVTVSRIGYVDPAPAPAAPPPVEPPLAEPPVEQWARDVLAPRPPAKGGCDDQVPSAAPTSPAPAGLPKIPDVPDGWLSDHHDRIAAVQEHLTSEGGEVPWWQGPLLTVNQVQALGKALGHGLSNRTTAQQVAKCLSRLRAERIVATMSTDLDVKGGAGRV